MIARLRFGFVAMLSFALAGSVSALEWTKTQISATPEPGTEVVRMKFEYKNVSKKRVQILEVKTSCGCTEATPDSSSIAPGDSGAVHVLFTIGKRTGLQEKEITLLTDDSNVPVRLTLKVKLPETNESAKVGAKK